MIPILQAWLADRLAMAPTVAAAMRSAWMWPLAESLHFIGLSLLVGSVVLFDLRLLGFARGIPIAAMHRLIRFGLAGFALNAVTGLAFLLTDATQYVFNAAFLWKLAFLAGAGVNALTFYATVGSRVLAASAPIDAPRRARAMALVSLCLWCAVIVAGRLLTFYRPFECAAGEAVGFVLLWLPPAR